MDRQVKQPGDKPHYAHEGKFIGWLAEDELLDDAPVSVAEAQPTQGPEMEPEIDTEGRWIAFADQLPKCGEWVVIYRGKAPRGEPVLCFGHYEESRFEGTGALMGWYCITDDVKARNWHRSYPATPKSLGCYVIDTATITHWLPIFPLPAFPGDIAV